MKWSLRFIVPLAFVLTAIAYGIIPLVDRMTLQWFVRDMDIRATLVANTLEAGLVPHLQAKDGAKILPLFNKVAKDERIFAIGFCDLKDKLVYRTTIFPESIACKPTQKNDEHVAVQELPEGPVHVSYRPMDSETLPFGQLVLIHDMSFVVRRSANTKQYVFYLFIAIGAIVSAITVLIARLSLNGWIKGIRAMLKGESLMQPHASPKELLPVMRDVRTLIRDLERDRKIRDEWQMSWTPQALKELLHRELAGDEVLIVSNREPYIHNRVGDKIEVQVPASGLVTALEPIMRACSGTWIAHGSGSADHEVVDKNDHVDVPPEMPCYKIRRVWLTKEEEEGYYYGFSNEGLWPLCHIAHTRPVFKTKDWQEYIKVNQKFADVVIQESKTEDPVILVQDYHFALLPKMIREKLPRATIITFWHIPWPNPEAFGICPWREEILEGLLGSSILGLHTQFHCNNFMESVDRFLECRMDKESSTISYGKKVTAVNPYPISIAWPTELPVTQNSITACRKLIREACAIEMGTAIGIGVDRLDYTKGILERFYAVERLLELYPEFVGKFTFIQIAAPTRASISEYQNFETEVRALAARINRRFAKDGYMPICLKIQHHGPKQVFEYFRGADVCMVTSLHDGMNLVAKEFVSSRDDERGVLILSQFAGASKELAEAIIINPYNIDQCAHALAASLLMTPIEQKDRMQSMRGIVQEFNVYRWAGRMLIDAARIRQKNRLMLKFKDDSQIGNGEMFS